MRDKHIIELLENAPFESLTETDINLIRQHGVECDDCLRAFHAAELSASFIRQRAMETIEPSPFFQTRVMAALRERQQQEASPALWRLWKSAGALVSSMAVTTAALAVLSFLVPAPSSTAPEETAAAYTADSVIFDQASDEQLSYEQVLGTIYAEDEVK